MNHALLTGTYTHPKFVLTYPWRSSVDAKVRQLPGRYFDSKNKNWIADGIGDNPEKWLKSNRFQITIDKESELAEYDIDELIDPCAFLFDSGNVLVRPRLRGFEYVANLLPGAQWDKNKRYFMTTVDEFFNIDGTTLEENFIMNAALKKALKNRKFSRPTPDPMLVEAMHAGKDLGRDLGLPQWFGMDLFDYQKNGAWALANSVNYIADEMGLGKTVQTLAAAAITGRKRILIACPAAALSVWEKEAHLCGFEENVGPIRTIVSGRKEPLLDHDGLTIVSMDMLSRRQGLKERVIDWQPDCCIVDEAHMLMNYASMRSKAVRAIAKTIDGPHWAISGTPMMSGPAQLAAQLDYTGDLQRVFNGYAGFMRRYCFRTPFGSWEPRKRNLKELSLLLDQLVWVRRTKDQALVNDDGSSKLPPRMISHDSIDVDTKIYRDCHKQVIEKIDDYLRQVGKDLNNQDITDFVQSNLSLITMLRNGAGLSKIDHAKQMIAEHLSNNPPVDGYYDRPLIVWVHHKDVGLAMNTKAKEECQHVAVYSGATSKAQRDSIVKDFQAGKIGVLVASIGAANASITLTACSDMIFVEQEWTPAIIAQAIARAWRIGQKRPVISHMLIATKTLDEHINNVLLRKGATLNAIAYSSDNMMAGYDYSLSARELLTSMVKERMEKR
ncbi:DEAD/DEAH box helicase [Actinomyces vulturis]|uniref:DEAD/DEAH box helicase n=1 Tax=Actinomyces vulturis TaxID=1857645 RepID=UPI00082A8F9C|nr:DEAD/DEAH box helicase [Actinomyces vulturis]